MEPNKKVAAGERPDLEWVRLHGDPVELRAEEFDGK
jgi:hypothetical protein